MVHTVQKVTLLQILLGEALAYSESTSGPHLCPARVVVDILL